MGCGFTTNRELVIGVHKDPNGDNIESHLNKFNYRASTNIKRKGLYLVNEVSASQEFSKIAGSQEFSRL